MTTNDRWDLLLEDGAIIDLGRLEAHDHQVAANFPGGNERWDVDASGCHAVIVGGVVVTEKGKHMGALPVEVLCHA